MQPRNILELENLLFPPLVRVCIRSHQSSEKACFKINQVKEYGSKNDQLLCLEYQLIGFFKKKKKNAFI